MRVRRGVVFTPPIGYMESPLPVNETSVTTKKIEPDYSPQLDAWHHGSDDVHHEQGEIEVEYSFSPFGGSRERLIISLPYLLAWVIFSFVLSDSQHKGSLIRTA